MEKVFYMDNAAATRLDEKVLGVMRPLYFESYSVATSEFGYSLGIEAREAMEDARGRLANYLGAKSDEFIFTSGSAESSNLALKGVAKALGSKKGKHIIVSKIEDFPVLYSARSLEKEGFKVDYLGVDADGFIDLETLKSLITPETILVSIQHGNQEIGTVQDIKSIGDLCHAKGVLFHTDATHTFMRVPLDVADIAVDLITVSAHTLHGPKGIGGLYIRKKTPLAKIMDSGFQEFDLRGGMDNIPGAVGFAKAVELITAAENQQGPQQPEQKSNTEKNSYHHSGDVHGIVAGFIRIFPVIKKSDDLQPQSLHPFSAPTGFESVPICSIRTSTRSPAAIGPTPGGVPVAIISPGSSVIIRETK